VKYSGKNECAMTSTNNGQSFPNLGRIRKKPNEPAEEGIPTNSLSECSKKIFEKGFSPQPSEYTRRTNW
jgi:hypothetical protein